MMHDWRFGLIATHMQAFIGIQGLLEGY